MFKCCCFCCSKAQVPAQKRPLSSLQRYGDGPLIAALSIVEEGDVKKIRMGHLAIIGANKINGVAAIHTEIIKKDCSYLLEKTFCTNCVRDQETFPEYYKWCCDNGEQNKIVPQHVKAQVVQRPF